MTTKEEIGLMKQRMDSMGDKLDKMDGKLDMLTEKLLDPDHGVTARVNRNTAFRKSTGKVLWSIWIALLGIIGKIIFWD